MSFVLMSGALSGPTNEHLFCLGRIIGLFRLSYLTPGLMAAGVTEVIVEKEQETSKDKIDYEGDAGGGESDTNNALVEQKKKK